MSLKGKYMWAKEKLRLPDKLPDSHKLLCTFLYHAMEASGEEKKKKKNILQAEMIQSK